MMRVKKYFSSKHFIAISAAILASCAAFCQEKEKLVGVGPSKTTTVIVDSTKEGVKEKIRVYDPKKAAVRSAIVPGLGQVYNKKYWKVPIIYGALGVSGAVFYYNLTNYRDTRFAYTAKYNASLPGATPADSAELLKIKPKLQPISMESLKTYRDEFRRDIDYSVVVFLLLWGLNVVDAAVDAHLKAFDVSPDLSLRIKPGHSQMAGTNGVSLVLAFR